MKLWHQSNKPIQRYTSLLLALILKLEKSGGQSWNSNFTDQISNLNDQISNMNIQNSGKEGRLVPSFFISTFSPRNRALELISDITIQWCLDFLGFGLRNRYLPLRSCIVTAFPPISQDVLLMQLLPCFCSTLLFLIRRDDWILR